MGIAFLLRSQVGQGTASLLYPPSDSVNVSIKGVLNFTLLILRKIKKTEKSSADDEDRERFPVFYLKDKDRPLSLLGNNYVQIEF